MAERPSALTTSDGVELEAEFDLTDQPVVAVLTHPHPQFGGDMHALVTDSLFRALPDEGIGVLRFNFRGVGRSTGQHDDGDGERLDVQTAVAAAHEHADGRPVVGVGYSFGADVLAAAVPRSVAALVLIAPPLQFADVQEVEEPCLVIVGEHDQFVSADRARQAADGWKDADVEVVPGADHFFGGGAAQLAPIVADFVRRAIPDLSGEEDWGVGS